MGTTNYDHTSSLVAEARELKDGLYMTVQAGYKAFTKFLDKS